MLSKELLRGPQPNGTVPPLTASCAPSPHHVLDYNPLSPSKLFYHDAGRLCDAILRMLSTNIVSDEAAFLSLSARFLKILHVSKLLVLLSTLPFYCLLTFYIQEISGAR